jgi:polar amino acid transport system permease protein
MLATLASGMLKSILIYVLTLIGSLPLGLAVAFGRMSKCKPLQLVVKFYISIMRGTPLMLQLMVVFFGPYYLFGLSLGSDYRFTAVIIGFIINYAAYFAEIYRGGIESIAVGQREAAQVLGYSRTSAFLRIILPQVIKRIIPSVTNEMITLVKDTSLAFAISYSEMFTLAKKIASSQATLMPFVIAGVFYYIFNFAVAYIMERSEKKLSYYK